MTKRILNQVVAASVGRMLDIAAAASWHLCSMQTQAHHLTADLQNGRGRRKTTLPAFCRPLGD